MNTNRLKIVFQQEMEHLILQLGKKSKQQYYRYHCSKLN